MANSIEINDLISDAVSNATERRKQAGELSEVSAEELENVTGGASLLVVRPFPIGIIYKPPITVGIIALPRS